MDHDKNFDQQFRTKANQIKVTPTETTWERVDQQLSKKRRNAVYYIVGIAASLFLLVGFVAILQLRSDVYENKHYQVEQFYSSANDQYQTALMAWIDFNHS